MANEPGAVEYDAAIQAARVATVKFRKVSEDYRARKIGDAEFIAARQEFNVANAMFDEAERAFIALQNEGE